MSGKNRDQNQSRRDRRPPAIVRSVTKAISVLLCIVLVVALLAAVAVMDLRKLTSAHGLENTITSILGAPGRVAALTRATAAASVVPLSNVSADDIPQDILANIGNGGAGAIVDWLYEELTKNLDGEVNFTSEDLRDFVENSTVGDYLSEKMAGFAQDFLNDTETTKITTEELMALLEENAEVLKQELKIELTEENKEKIKSSIREVVEESNLNETLRETVKGAVKTALKDGLGVELADVLNTLQMLTSDSTLYMVLGICLALVLVLCLLNFYNVAAGLTWSGIAGMIAGLLTAVPVMLVQANSNLLVSKFPGLANFMGAVDSVLATIAPVHYGLLIGGVVVFALSLVWRFFAWSAR